MRPPEFIEACRSAVASGEPPEAIRALVERALASQQADREIWNGEELMYRADDLLIVNLTLPAHAMSAVHDHGTWAVIGMSRGTEMEHFHEERGGQLVKTGELEVKAGQAIVLGPQTIHAISNPHAEPGRGIHVYGRDLVTAPRHMWHPRTGEKMPFDFKVFVAWEAQLSREARRVTP